ncbi:MAG: tetratricopeptide repeat protein, partial [Anaerolineae bacterium]
MRPKSPFGIRTRLPVAAVAGALLLAAATSQAGCRRAATPETEPSPDASPTAADTRAGGPEAGPAAAPRPPSERAQLLLAKGLAHADLEEWDEAQQVFQDLADLVPDEPVARLDLAVALYQQGDLAAASAILDDLVMPAGAPGSARLDYYRGVIASHQGDPDAAFALYEAAFEAAPDETAYAFAAAQEAMKATDVSQARRGELLAAAHELWGDNTAIATAYAMWAVASADGTTRRRGLEVLGDVVQAVGGEDVAAALAEGAADLESAAPGLPLPRLQIVANLVQATPRFGRDQAAVDARLGIAPLDQFVL